MRLGHIMQLRTSLKSAVSLRGAYRSVSNAESAISTAAMPQTAFGARCELHMDIRPLPARIVLNDLNGLLKSTRWPRCLTLPAVRRWRNTSADSGAAECPPDHQLVEIENCWAYENRRGELPY